MAMVCDVAFIPLDLLTNLHPVISALRLSISYQMRD